MVSNFIKHIRAACLFFLLNTNFWILLGDTHANLLPSLDSDEFTFLMISLILFPFLWWWWWLLKTKQTKILNNIYRSTSLSLVLSQQTKKYSFVIFFFCKIVWQTRRLRIFFVHFSGLQHKKKTLKIYINFNQFTILTGADLWTNNKKPHCAFFDAFFCVYLCLYTQKYSCNKTRIRATIFVFHHHDHHIITFVAQTKDKISQVKTKRFAPHLPLFQL